MNCWYIVIIDNDKFGREYIECDSLSDAEEAANSKFKDYKQLYGIISNTQILKVVDEL